MNPAAVIGCSLASGTLTAGGIGTDHFRPDAGQRLGQKPAAAADIEDAQPFQAVEPFGVTRKMHRRLVADITQPDRIELVQGRHRAARIPPGRGQPGKPLDFGGIDGGFGGA